MGSQDASSNCLVNAHGRILGTHTLEDLAWSDDRVERHLDRQLVNFERRQKRIGALRR